MFSQHLDTQNRRYQNFHERIGQDPIANVSIKWSHFEEKLAAPNHFHNLINIDRIVFVLKHIGVVYNNKMNIVFSDGSQYFDTDSLILQSRIKLVSHQYDESIILLKGGLDLISDYEELKYVFSPLIYILLALNYKHKKNKNKAQYYLSKFNHAIAQLNAQGVEINDAIVNKIDVLLNGGDVTDTKNPFLPKDLKGRDLGFILRVVSVIDQNLDNEELSVNLLSKELFLSHSQIYRKVLALTDYTVAELIRLVKLYRAKYRLENNLGTISEVSSQICYTRSHFSRAFSKQFGYSPKEIK